MVKINLTRFSALVLACMFFAGTTNAQTKVWGVGSGVGVAEAEFSTPFIQSGVAGNYSATQWTALSIFEDDGNGNQITPGAAYWTRSLLGYSQGAYWGGTTPMGSASQANGMAIFDSDYLDNNGVQGAFGTGTSPSPHKGELISPRIDLTGYTDSALVVSFFSYYREFQINELSVAVSVDDGTTWVQTVDYRAVAPNEAQATARVTLANATAGVSNLSQCRIKFTFDNDYYHAIIDDVTIEVAPKYDIALGNADPASTLLVGNGDYVKVGGNPYNPLNNIVHSNDMRNWFWGGKAVNYGYADIVPDNNAVMYMSVDFTDAITAQVTPNVYMDTTQFDTLYSGDVAGVTNIEYLRDLAFINTYGQGTYTVTYWLAQDSLDGSAANDTVRHTFTITGDAPTSNYLSKARLAASDGKVFASRAIFPGSGGPFGAFEYGSVYYFPRGASDTITIDSVDFRYRLSNAFTGGASQTLFCNVYEMTNTTAGVLNDDAFLTQIGVAPITLNGLGTTVAAGDYGLATVDAFVDAGTGGAMAGLKDNAYYFVSVLTNPSLLGGPATFDANDVPQPGADENNFYMNAAMTRGDSIINPSPLKITDGAGTATWYWSGFGSDYVPSIGIYLGIKPMNPVSVSTVWEEAGAELNLYPNPASSNLNISLSLDNASDVDYIVTDMTGRVLQILHSTNVSEETKSIDISNLPAGVYMVTAKTAEGASTERFTKS